MASVRRSSLHSLIEQILKDAAHLPFEGVVRVLQQAHPDAPDIGFDGPPYAEAIRFKQNPSLGFSSGDLHSVRRVADDGSGFRGFEVTTNFLGLAGVDSPLPNAYVEEFLHAAVHDDDVLVLGLLDIFHHRMVSMLVRSLEKYHHSATYRSNGSDRFSSRLADLSGGAASEQIDTGQRARFAAVFMRQARSESDIEYVLKKWFNDIDIHVVSCVPRWVQVPNDQRVRLGHANHQLGVDVVIGEFILDASSTFAISVGPLNKKQFQEFLPNGQAASEMRALLSQVDVDGLGARIQLHIDDDMQGMRLSSAPEEASALGWSSWLAGNISRPTTVTYTWENIGHD
ncbi:MAG: type VI secretion system baseplate subunit TssG [Planctomycetes bacterium]|nr:type VI secretion system baseplate subunit TssG [Planctomycetota bacterium]